MQIRNPHNRFGSRSILSILNHDVLVIYMMNRNIITIEMKRYKLEESRVMSLHVIILAAGLGKRMQSSTPKVLHTIGGTPMFEHVVQTASSLNPDTIYAVIGHEGERIRSEFQHLDIQWVEQGEMLGTGHAVLQAMPLIPSDATVLVLYADVPLIRTETLAPLIQTCLGQNRLGLLVTEIDNPFGLGRVLRHHDGGIYAIVEEKDATETQRQIKEIYTGICCTSAANLNRWLPQLNQKNSQREYYLTDIITMAVSDNLSIFSLNVVDTLEVQGVNDRLQLQLVERGYQFRLAQHLMKSGVTLADAARIDIRGNIHSGHDIFIDVNNVFCGEIAIGNHSVIEPNCVIKNSQIGQNCTIHAHSVIEDCVIGDNCQIGPFARLRPGTRLANDCKIGNFVETKNAVFGAHTKANHLSYLGDVTLGSKVNVGAGTITCNYDGAKKHQTIIEDEVHIGSDTQLVAPVTVGKKATIGAGSTIRRDVPAGELTLTATEQKTIYGWKRPQKEENIE